MLELVYAQFLLAQMLYIQSLAVIYINTVFKKPYPYPVLVYHDSLRYSLYASAGDDLPESLLLLVKQGDTVILGTYPYIPALILCHVSYHPPADGVGRHVRFVSLHFYRLGRNITSPFEAGTYPYPPFTILVHAVHLVIGQAVL